MGGTFRYMKERNFKILQFESLKIPANIEIHTQLRLDFRNMLRVTLDRYEVNTLSITSDLDLYVQKLNLIPSLLMTIQSKTRETNLRVPSIFRVSSTFFYLEDKL